MKQFILLKKQNNCSFPANQSSALPALMDDNLFNVFCRNSPFKWL